MSQNITLSLTPRQSSLSEEYLPIAARQLGVAQDRIAFARVVKRSIDARRGKIKVNLTLELFIDGEQLPEQPKFEWGDVVGRTQVVVVGAGPAGLFAALRLIELGLCPIIIERGRDVSTRKRDIAQINRGASVNPDSNYSFGEGGAGAYSDGKLFSRSKKRGDFRRILDRFHHFGADESILYDAHPHIGTDRLPQIIAAMREQIKRSGGKILFETSLEDIEIKNNRVQCVVTRSGERIEAAGVILATGHSARDIYELLHRRGVRLEEKSFAVGVRVEHPQSMIDTMQYHLPERGEWLPAAAYSLVAQVGGRGVYSFCMCPGGFIVPAMTADDQAVVNGMSPWRRNSPYANSGIVTEVRVEDYADLIPKYGVLAGVEFQRRLEQTAALNGGDKHRVPAQRLTDFVNGKMSTDLPVTSYVPGVVPSQMGDWLPKFITRALRGGFQEFDKKMKGFITNRAQVLGVESRTSSPVRIPRDAETLRHVEVENLYPSAEGAGYAGGILSAAIDGERCAEAVARDISSNWNIF